MKINNSELFFILYACPQLSPKPRNTTLDPLPASRYSPFAGGELELRLGFEIALSTMPDRSSSPSRRKIGTGSAKEGCPEGTGWSIGESSGQAYYFIKSSR